MRAHNLHKIFTLLIVGVWFINGLYAKILNQVPRHQEIVGRILGDDYAFWLTKLIGVAELVMVFWILSKFQRKLNAITQIIIVGVMNLIEFSLVPDLLLWGKFNLVFAFLFILIIYFNEFVLVKVIKSTN